MSAKRVVAGLAIIVGLVLVGRWTMRPDDVMQVSVRADGGAAVEDPSASSPLPGTDKALLEAGARSPPSASFGSFRGRVIDAMTRQPVREFELRFHGTRPTQVGDEAPGARGFRTADGRFEWEYLPPGGWTVTVTAPGYQRFELEDLAVPRGHATREVVVPLRHGYALRGRVYDQDSGGGIAGASIAFRESAQGRFEGNWRSRVRASSAKDGSFVIDGVPAGRVTLEVSAQDHAGRELEVVVGSEIAPIEIGLAAGGTIAGRLTAADGVTPVAGAAGVFNLDQGFGGTGRTGKAGEFSFEHLPAGRYQLTGQAEGGGVAREIVLAENQRIEGLVLALNAGGNIRGTVTGLRPEELARVGISMRRDDAAGNPYADVRVDDRGRYALHGVLPGRVHLVAELSMRRQLTKTIEMPADADITVDLDFPAGARLSGRVTRAGTPLPEVWVEPRPDVEQPIYVYGTSTSKDGRYVIENLTAGDYDLLVGDYRTRRFQVSGDTVFDVEVPPAQLAGRVLEKDGKVPVVGAVVEIWPAEVDSSQPRRQDRSDHFGRFALAGLEPGDLVLTAYKRGYEMFRERISYDSPISDLTLRLREGSGVDVRVRDASSGKPLREISAIEMIGKRHGSRLYLHLDDQGLGSIPSALAGSTLSLSAFGYLPLLVTGWSGQPLDVQLQRQKEESP